MGSDRFLRPNEIKAKVKREISFFAQGFPEKLSMDLEKLKKAKPKNLSGSGKTKITIK